MPEGHGLGLRQHTDAKRPRLLTEPISLAISVEKKLDVPTRYREYYDQGAEGACVGFGFSWMMSILNKRKYDALWLYREAQKVDPWSDTPPEEGTSEVAGAQVLITQGHRRIWGGIEYMPRVSDGIAAVRWANPSSPVDELRACIANGTPFGMAIPWHHDFDKPLWDTKLGWTIGRDRDNLGSIRGWHFICSYGAKDSIEMFYLVNSWGYDYPMVKIPYKTVEKMGGEGAAFAVITDR